MGGHTVASLTPASNPLLAFLCQTHREAPGQGSLVALLGQPLTAQAQVKEGRNGFRRADGDYVCGTELVSSH